MMYIGANSLYKYTRLTECASVAQLDRATAFEAVGRRFESYQTRHFCCFSYYFYAVFLHPLNDLIFVVYFVVYTVAYFLYLVLFL